jgi:hypothetical protein
MNLSLINVHLCDGGEGMAAYPDRTVRRLFAVKSPRAASKISGTMAHDSYPQKGLGRSLRATITARRAADALRRGLD